MNAFNLSNQGLSFLWQEMRDSAKWEFDAAQNNEDRVTLLKQAALANEAATDADKVKALSNLAKWVLDNL
jgi:hypothetical protein